MEPQMNTTADTIAAISTPAGVGGIAVIRLSGPQAYDIAARFWKGSDLSKAASHTAHLGYILDADGGAIDQCVATIFHAPNSYTGEDTIEFSIHGGRWLQQAALIRMTECGARMAEPGEFTRRAFLNGRIDLAQAEGIADLIAASSRAAARMAVTQTRGDFSRRLSQLRESLIEFASLLELELDFSEEDVEFADRTRLMELCDETLRIVRRLADSYRAGNVFKHGVPVAIAGAPNAGKSTLLNLLAGDERAIVSDIPGTTRDVIEDAVEIDGVLYRFYDTAGLRDTSDEIERLGIDRARRKIADAQLLLWLHDATNSSLLITNYPLEEKPTLILLNKSDLVSESEIERLKQSFHQAYPDAEILPFSAKTGEGEEELKAWLKKQTQTDFDPQTELMVSNGRHYEALTRAADALTRAREGLNAGTADDETIHYPLSADFIAQDVREAILHLSSITGSITSTDLLSSIFSRFCIGK